MMVLDLELKSPIEKGGSYSNKSNCLNNWSKPSNIVGGKRRETAQVLHSMLRVLQHRFPSVCSRKSAVAWCFGRSVYSLRVFWFYSVRHTVVCLPSAAYYYYYLSLLCSEISRLSPRPLSDVVAFVGCIIVGCISGL